MEKELGEIVTIYKAEKQEAKKQESNFVTPKHSDIKMSKKLLDLIKFDKFTIEKSKKHEGVIYYTGYIKNLTVWSYTNHEDKPFTRNEAIRKSKERFISDLWDGHAIELSSDENKAYFIQLQKELFAMRDEVNKWLDKKHMKLRD